MPRPPRPSRLVCKFCRSVPYIDSLCAPPLTPQVVNSLLTLQLNDANQITRHTEEWDHNRETTADDGFLGMLNEHRKRMTATLTDVFMSKAR
jgi:hypothetical protein